MKWDVEVWNSQDLQGAVHIIRTHDFELFTLSPHPYAYTKYCQYASFFGFFYPLRSVSTIYTAPNTNCNMSTYLKHWSRLANMSSPMSESNLLPVKKQNKKLLFEILETFFAWCWKEKSIGRRRRGTSKQNLIDLHEWVHSAEDRLPVGSSSAMHFKVSVLSKHQRSHLVWKECAGNHERPGHNGYILLGRGALKRIYEHYTRWVGKGAKGT